MCMKSMHYFFYQKKMNLINLIHHPTKRNFVRYLTDEQIKAILKSNYETGFEEDFQKLIRDLNTSMAGEEWNECEFEVHVLDVGFWMIKIVDSNPLKRFFKETWRPKVYFILAEVYPSADLISADKKLVSENRFNDLYKGTIGLENIIVKYRYWKYDHVRYYHWGSIPNSEEMTGNKIVKYLRDRLSLFLGSS